MRLLKNFFGIATGFFLGAWIFSAILGNISYFTKTQILKDFYGLTFSISIYLTIIFFILYMWVALTLMFKIFAMSKVLFNECDIEKYTELNSKITFTLFWRKFDEKMQLASFKAVEYIVRDEYKKALDLMYSIDISRVKTKFLKSLYYCTLVICYVNLHDFVRAFDTYNEGKKFIEMKRPMEVRGHHVAVLLNVDIDLIRKYIGLLNNESADIQSYEKYYFDYLNNSRLVNYGKNIARYNLCVVYKVTKDIEKLKHFCEELVLYGNNLPMVSKAKDMLNELEDKNNSLEKVNSDDITVKN